MGTYVGSSEHEARNAMMGETIRNIVYVIDDGHKETMWLVFDRFAIKIRSDSHIFHTAAAVNEVPG